MEVSVFKEVKPRNPAAITVNCGLVLPSKRTWNRVDSAIRGQSHCRLH
jgi:hypothetical protein